MRRRRFLPTCSALEPRLPLDGEAYALAFTAPPPVDQPGPIGGVLGGPETLPSGARPTAQPLLLPEDLPPPPPEGDPSLVGYEAVFPEFAGGPVYVAPFDAFA